MIGCVLCLPRRDFARVRAFFLRKLGARDFSSAVSGFCQVFIVTSDCRDPHEKFFSPLANTENSRRTREKPLVYT